MALRLLARIALEEQEMSRVREVLLVSAVGAMSLVASLHESARGLLPEEFWFPLLLGLAIAVGALIPGLGTLILVLGFAAVVGLVAAAVMLLGDGAGILVLVLCLFAVVLALGRGKEARH